MGHYIDAIIGYKNSNIELKAKNLNLALIFESEFVIVPLIEENIYHYEIENNIQSEDFGEDVTWDCTTTVMIAEYLELEKFVIIKLESSDFIGTYYEGKNKIIHEVDINSALNNLGVPKGKNTEFDYLNLDNYRNSEIYYMDEEIANNTNSNIIKGKRLVPDWNKYAE